MKVCKFSSKTLPWRVTAPALFDGVADRKTYYFAKRSDADAFSARIKRWKIDRKNPAANTAEYNHEDLHWLGTIRARLGSLDLIPEVLTHWERTGAGAIHKMTVLDAARQYVAW